MRQIVVVLWKFNAFYSFDSIATAIPYAPAHGVLNIGLGTRERVHFIRVALTLALRPAKEIS
jgi:hypothetical protein